MRISRRGREFLVDSEGKLQRERLARLLFLWQAVRLPYKTSCAL